VVEEKPSEEKEDLFPKERGGLSGFGKKGLGQMAKPVEILAHPNDEKAGPPPPLPPAANPLGASPQAVKLSWADRPSLSGWWGGYCRISSKRLGVRKTKDRNLGSLQNHTAKAALTHQQASWQKRRVG